ncbi:MAG: flippase-like domain-containing protein [Archangium sp.]|nr:flippase-like domain-containing protein [Archangium sp.]
MSRWIKGAVSLAITAICMWWTFKDTNFPQMWTSLKSANWMFTLPVYLLILVVIHLARTLRWGNLLSGLEKVPFSKLNEASAIGFMMLIILPFRLGEFARPFLIAQRSGIRRSAAMTSVVLERIIDGLIIAVLLRVLMFFVPDDARDIDRIRIGANLMFLVFGSGFLFLVLARWKHDLVIGLMRKTMGRISAGATEKVVHIVDGFVGALKQLPDAKNMAMFLFWTAVYWVANGAGMAFFANGFDCSGANGAECLPLTMTLFQGYFILCVVIVGMMIPAAPGSAGTAQLALLIGMGVFVSQQVVNSSGVAYANVLWLVQIVQQILFGLFFLVRSHTSFSEVAGKLSEQQQKGDDSDNDAQRTGASA